MPFQTKVNLTNKLKTEINIYRILRKNMEGLDLTEKQVMGLMANEANFYQRVAALKNKATRNLNQKQIDNIKKQIEFTRKKYGIF